MVYKNGENLKILIEIFCQKLIASNVILDFLDHLRPKIFFVGQPWPTYSAPSPFRNLWIRPCIRYLKGNAEIKKADHLVFKEHLGTVPSN